MHCLGVSWALDLGTHSPHYLLYMIASLHFHLTSLVVLFVSSCLSYLLLICIIFFHPKWWSSSIHYMEGSPVISTIYPTDVGPRILSLRRSHLQRKFMLHWHLRVCLSILTSSLGFLGLHSEHVYICKKKKSKCRDVWYSLSLSVYIGVRGSLCWVCLLIGVRMSAPRDVSFFVFICHMFWEWDEWHSLRSFGSSSIPSLHSLLTWLPCIFDLSGSSLILVFCASSSSLFSLRIHHFHSTFYLFLTVTHFRVWYSLRIIIIHLVISLFFSPLHHHHYHVHIRHPQVHGSWDLLYLLHFIHEGMGFDHRVFELSFPSFLSSYHPSLCYVPCLETTLRPWDQMSSSTTST